MTHERSRLVARVHQHLERRGRPRLELFVLVSLAGMAGFLVSYGLLAGGMASMPIRYGIAGVAGYLAFLCLIAVWIAVKRRIDSPWDAVDALDVLNVADLSASVSAPAPRSLFEGGRSGGGGASAAWDHRGSGMGGGSGGSWLDADELGWMILIAAAAFAGVIAVGYVVYLAPALLAEVVVDAVIVATISRKIAATERRDWTATVLRRTWLPATVLVAMLMIGGWGLQRIAPDARSIGPAVGELLER